jgi:hypothetical protein
VLFGAPPQIDGQKLGTDMQALLRIAPLAGANVPVDCGWLVAPSWHTYGGLRQPGNA